MNVIKFEVGNILEMKKPHPCGNKNFRILRVGSICRVVCLSCGRDMELDRIQLEKAIKRTVTDEESK